MNALDRIAVQLAGNIDDWKKKPFFTLFCVVLGTGIGSWLMSYVGGRETTFFGVFAGLVMGSFFAVLICLACRWWCSFRSLSWEANGRNDFILKRKK